MIRPEKSRISFLFGPVQVQKSSGRRLPTSLKVASIKTLTLALSLCTPPPPSGHAAFSSCVHVPSKSQPTNGEHHVVKDYDVVKRGVDKAGTIYVLLLNRGVSVALVVVVMISGNGDGSGEVKLLVGDGDGR
ncbi:hypothetical protein PIB30_065273 [Stylosanthes scabra]|uniref:Uncharacterized protein n=1 Tax=Stylosanthes scabra TaxID=79078 RepID=A0ABU6VN10_9FABA|nr:hypothetical protein [Stylosanthes scabra]